MTVKAIDKDENENGRVTYHLKVGDENVQETAEFSIGENTGVLRTRQTLDRESRPRYQVSYENIIILKYILLKFINCVVYC